MVKRLLTLSTLALAMILAACGSGPDGEGHDEMVTTIVHGDPEPQGMTETTTSGHGPSEGWMLVFIGPGATQEDIDSVGAAIASAAPDAVYNFGNDWLEFEIAAGHEADVTTCFQWALPSFSVNYDPATDDGQAVVDAVEQLDAVVGLDAFGLDTTLPRPDDGEEAFIKCES